MKISIRIVFKFSESDQPLALNELEEELRISRTRNIKRDNFETLEQETKRV